MKFHLLSDIHLEFSTFELEVVEGCDALILAGDIGNPTTKDYHDLVKHAAYNYKYVFIVKGNHECFGLTVEETCEQIERVCSDFDNVIFLNRSVFDVDDDIRIAGTTLWSEISDCQRGDIGRLVSDFRCIKDWSIELHNQLHYQDVSFIDDEIYRATRDGKRLVVVTHHAPCVGITSKPEHRGSTISSAFATDLMKLIQPPIVVWAFGHTHYSTKFFINEVMIVSNQRGYKNESSNYSPHFTFRV